MPRRWQKSKAFPRPVAQTPVAAITVACPACNTGYRVPADAAGKRIRCKRCQGIIDIPRTPARP